MAAPTTPILDNFNRANGGIGSNYTTVYGSPVISSNQLNPGSGGSAAYWNTPTSGAAAEAYIELRSVPASFYAGGMLVDVATGGAYIVYSEDGSAFTFYRVSPSSVLTQLGSVGSQSWSVGDSVALARNGDAIEGYRRPSGGGAWELLDSRTDSTYPGASGYYPGWDSTVPFDNFGGGSTVVATPTTAGLRRALLGVG